MTSLPPFCCIELLQRLYGHKHYGEVAGHPEQNYGKYLWREQVFEYNYTHSTKLHNLNWRVRKSARKKTNSVALSPRANYTDWATATCRRNLVPTFMDRGMSRGQRGGSPTVVNLIFLDRKSARIPMSIHQTSQLDLDSIWRHTAALLSHQAIQIDVQTDCE
jgi:hypothetical protein